MGTELGPAPYTCSVVVDGGNKIVCGQPSHVRLDGQPFCRFHLEMWMHLYELLTTGDDKRFRTYLSVPG